MASESETSKAANLAPEAPPVARRVAFDAPWTWLAKGWDDLWSRPGISLAYGTTFAAAAIVLIACLLLLDALAVFLPLAGGFLLLGPFLAVGLYQMSRLRARNENPTLRKVAWAWFDARGQLGFFGALLLLVYFVWVRLAFLLLMLFFGPVGVSPPETFMQDLLFTPRGLGLLTVGTAAGAALAVLIFTTTALSIPMLLARRVDVVTAARASFSAVMTNPKPMALWASLIVVIMAAGFATLLLGLIVAFPLVGHATWHAYTDFFGDEGE
jgi:uncharacterized membrane protein